MSDGWDFSDRPISDAERRNERQLKDAVREVLSEIREAERQEAEEWDQAVNGAGRAFCLTVAVFSVGCASIFGFEFYQWYVGGPMASSMPWTIGGLSSSVAGLLVLLYYGIFADD